MFWPFVLPAQITFGILLALFIAAVIIARKYRKAGTVAFGGCFISLLAFIPCCMGVQALVDPYRFGVFEYPSHDLIGDARVKRNMPEAATAIIVDQGISYFRAKYTVDQKAVEAWFDRQWTLHGGTSRTQRVPNATLSEFDRTNLNEDFAALSVTIPGNAVVYEGPRQSNGRGFTLYYDTANSTVYQFMGYW